MEDMSGPILEGVLVIEGKLCCVCHDASGRGSKGGGESMEMADMVSKSGVPGSRYGFVVFMKVTSGELAVARWPSSSGSSPFFGMSIQMVSSSNVFL